MRIQIDTADAQQKWRFKCPESAPTILYVHNGTFGCRHCRATVDGLVDDPTGEIIPTDTSDFVGPQANHKSIEVLPAGKSRYRYISLRRVEFARVKLSSRYAMLSSVI